MNLDALIIDQPFYGSLIVLADLFIKGILILAGARLLTAFLSRSAAAARHLIWATALLMILLLPLFSAILPKVNVPLLQQPFQHSPGITEKAPTSPVIAEWTPERSSVSASSPHASSREFISEESVATTPLVTSQLASNDKGWSFWVPYVEILQKAHWTTLVLGAWSLGAILVLGWTLLGVAGAWWITRQARPPGEDVWTDLNDELADRLLVYRPVRLLMSSSISSPMTWGIWRPVILLPIDADDWSDERRRYVLLHEMAHIKRWDTLTQFGAQLSCTLNWFNPLAWRGLHRMRIEQEKACDDLVLAHGMKASEYARHLLDIARSLKMPWVSPLNTISMAKPSQLEGRVVDILDPGRKKRTMNRFSAVFTCVLALSVMLPISALSPWQEEVTDYLTQEPAASTPIHASVLAGENLDRENQTANENQAKIAFDSASSLRLARVGSEGSEAQAERALEIHLEKALADTTEKQRRARKMAILALRKSLEDKNAEVRRYAAMTLGEMEDEGSIDALIKLLKTDKDPEVRRFAVGALCELGSPKAIDAYLIALNDKNEEVRRFAVMALAEHDDERAMEALIKALDDSNADIRRFAIMGIADHGGEQVNMLLIKMLDDEDMDVRRHALMGLADRSDKEALPAIKKALNDSDPEIRRFAVMALSEYEDQESLRMIRKALDDNNNEVRRHALMAIADREDKDSLPIFIDLLLNDNDPEVRRHAAVAIGEIGDVEAVEALTKALNDKNAEVRRFAAMALSELDYGDDDWDDDDWDGNAEGDEDGDEWGEVDWEERDWEGAEEFGEAMAKLGVSAGQFGLAVGELSLNLTADVLSELGHNLQSIDFENDLALLEQDLFMSEMELKEKMFELEHLQIELENEWNEESFESILEVFDELEPLFNVSPTLCEQAASIFDERDDKTRKRALKRLECKNRIIFRD